MSQDLGSHIRNWKDTTVAALKDFQNRGKDSSPVVVVRPYRGGDLSRSFWEIIACLSEWAFNGSSRGNGGSPMDSFQERWYWAIGDWIGGTGWLIAFLASWWYCAATYGFLFGFGLGWLPSLILASLIALALKVLWGPALLLVGFAAWKLSQG